MSLLKFSCYCKLFFISLTTLPESGEYLKLRQLEIVTLQVRLLVFHEIVTQATLSHLSF